MDRLERLYLLEAKKNIKKTQMYRVVLRGRELSHAPMVFVDAYNLAKKIGNELKVQCHVEKIK